MSSENSAEAPAFSLATGLEQQPCRHRHRRYCAVVPAFSYSPIMHEPTLAAPRLHVDICMIDAAGRCRFTTPAGGDDSGV
jgi:hypothetical protein